jgi:tetratricopeptide (TPR) repeat protein
MLIPKPPSSPPILSGERSVDTELEQVKNQTLARWLNKFEGLSNLQIVPFLKSMKARLPALEAKYPEDPQLIQLRGMILESEGDSARDVNDHAKAAERYQQACSLVEKLIELTPNDPAAYGYHSLLLDQLAKAYLAIDDEHNMNKASEKSMQIQCGALNRWPYLPEMRIRMAERSVGRLIILRRLDRTPDAIECVDEAIRTLRSKPFSPKWQTAAERLHSNLSLFASELRKTLNPAN